MNVANVAGRVVSSKYYSASSDRKSSCLVCCFYGSAFAVTKGSSED